MGFRFPTAERIFRLGPSRGSRVAFLDRTAGQESPPVFRPTFPFEKEVILV